MKNEAFLPQFIAWCFYILMVLGGNTYFCTDSSLNFLYFLFWWMLIVFRYFNVPNSLYYREIRYLLNGDDEDISLKLIASYWLEMGHVWNDWDVNMKRGNEVNQDSRMAVNEDWHCRLQRYSSNNVSFLKIMQVKPIHKEI